MSQVNTNAIYDASGGNAAKLYGSSMRYGGTAFVNRIINGDMRIDQRNAGASVTITNTAATTYTLDRWYGYGNSGSRFSIQRNAGSVTPPPGFTNYLGVTSLSAYSPLTGEGFPVGHSIEGLNVADLGWGTANAQSVTLSFWVRSSLTGTFAGSLRNSALNRSYVFTYAISSANTWEYKTITIAGDTTGTWLTDNGVGINLVFSMGAGSGQQVTAGSWQAGNAISTAGAVSVVGTNGATFYITGVQLEAGTVATPFERRDYGRELMMCQRYYEVGGIQQIYSGYVVSGEYYYNPVRYAVVKRTAPTVTPGSINGTNLFVSRFPATQPNISSSADMFYAQGIANSTGTGYFQYSWTASAEL